MLGEHSIEEFVMGVEIFHEGSAGFTSITLKKKMKKFFFHLEVSSSIKT